MKHTARIHSAYRQKVPSIFLSHSSQDKVFARKLANDLRKYGAKVWLDEAEIRPGDSLIEKISRGIIDAQFLFVVLTPTSCSSPWVQREVNVALTQEINGRFIKVVPLLLETCQMPAFLLDKKYVDFRSDRVNAFWKIVIWLGIETRNNRITSEKRFLDHFICYDLVNQGPAHDLDHELIWFLSVQDFRTFLDRIDYFGIKIIGVEPWSQKRGILSPVVYTPADFPKAGNGSNDWCYEVIRVVLKKYGNNPNIALSPSWDIPEELYTDFGVLDYKKMNSSAGKKSRRRRQVSKSDK